MTVSLRSAWTRRPPRQAARSTRRLLFHATHPTATKPLTPSHVKGLLFFDVLTRVTGRMMRVTPLANRVTCDVTAQNLAFWHHLDTRYADVGAPFYADKDDLWVGREYVRFHEAGGGDATPAEIEALRLRVEQDYWMHPAGRRVLGTWREQLALLGVTHRLDSWQPLEVSVDGALAAIEEAGLCLDARSMGGGVYLDRTADGVPLRQLVDEHGVPNYLVHVLRELLAEGPHHDAVLLGYDSDARDDYALIATVLRASGIETATFELDRVRLPGVSGTTRTGGWEPYTLGRLADRYVPEYGVEAFRLGMRMYHVLHLGRRGGQEFDLGALERFIRRGAGAAARLDLEDGDPDQRVRVLREVWERSSAPHGAFADPNRAMQALIESARGSVEGRALTRELLVA